VGFSARWPCPPQLSPPGKAQPSPADPRRGEAAAGGRHTGHGRSRPDHGARSSAGTRSRRGGSFRKRQLLRLPGCGAGTAHPAPTPSRALAALGGHRSPPCPAPRRLLDSGVHPVLGPEGPFLLHRRSRSGVGFVRGQHRSRRADASASSKEPSGHRAPAARRGGRRVGGQRGVPRGLRVRVGGDLGRGALLRAAHAVPARDVRLGVRPAGAAAARALQLVLDAVHVLRHLVDPVELGKQHLEEGEEALDVSVHFQAVAGAQHQAQPIQLAGGGGGPGAVGGSAGSGAPEGLGVARVSGRQRLHPFEPHLVPELEENRGAGGRVIAGAGARERCAAALRPAPSTPGLLLAAQPTAQPRGRGPSYEHVELWG